MNMKLEKFKTKDFVTIGIITALYTLMSFILNAVFKFIPLPAFGVFLSTAAFSLLIGGVIVLFLINKIPKFGVLTLLTLIYILLHTIIGASYLPWFLMLVAGSIIGDFLAHSGKYNSKFKNALAFAFMQTGNMAGAVIPTWFFVEQYTATWKAKGMSEEALKVMVNSTAGYYGAILLIVTFIAAFFGIYLGYAVLAKHFKKQEN